MQPSFEIKCAVCGATKTVGTFGSWTCPTDKTHTPVYVRELKEVSTT